MKDLEMKQVEQTETAENTLADTIVFAEMLVYNEMADQTSFKMNLVDQIHSQLNQLEELTHKRQFMLKEVLQHIVD